MFGLSTDAYVDLNGSGKLDQGDQVGFGYGNTTAEALILGCGYHYTRSSNGKMKLNFDDENLVTLMQWMVQQYQQDGIVYQRSTEIDYGAMVDAGQCLFDSPNAFDLGAYRELEYDFGLVPFPKKDEMQSEYIRTGETEITTVYAANRAGVENFFADLEATFAEYRRSLEK